MTWLRQSDTLWRDFEFTKLTDGAQALWHRANSWIADQLSDGFIPESAIKGLNTRKRYVQELQQAGYWVWQCASRDEAIEWLKRAPFDGGTEIELRQIFEADDFGEQLTPDLREANERLREQSAQN